MTNPNPDSVQMTQKGVLPRDDNDNAIQYQGLYINTSITLSANGTTASVPIFHVTGTVLLTGLWGVVTTALGNNTAAYWRLNDQTAQSDITLNTGTTLTNAPAGSWIGKRLAATNALTLLSASQERAQDSGATGSAGFEVTILVQKTGAVQTDIEFTYTTSDTPTSGVIQFFASYVPLSANGKLTTV